MPIHIYNKTLMCSMDTLQFRGIKGIHIMEACNNLKKLNLDFGQIQLKEKRQKEINITNYNPIPIEIRSIDIPLENLNIILKGIYNEKGQQMFYSSDLGKKLTLQ